ncbi:MAG: hypothetical protein ACD_60C00005G0002 [uncultured bacterium]|nr:MAG: hypothetical protein ACD_60C00005G0002 [uncultured bacterium]
MNALKTLNHYTPEDILEMDYNHIIGIVKETNRPPGGINSLACIAQKIFLGPNKHVLEIGTSTGFTAIELARLTHCNISAIDINPESLAEAKFRAKENNIEDKIKFIEMDATEINFNNELFDLVFCGNVTSLIPNRKKALKEYSRVLKNNGYLAAIPIYYLETPSDQLLSNVSKAIQVDLKPIYKDYWIDFFNQKPLHIFYQEDYQFDFISDKYIKKFTNQILSRPHLKLLNTHTKEMLCQRYQELMLLFRDNLAKMGYTILILRKEENSFDPELFTSSKV